MSKEKKIKINDIEYEVVKDYKDAIDTSVITEMYTDYFEAYDYLFGDWSYGKLRLKGFCDKGNKLKNDINSYDKIDDYIKTYCAYECSYFILKKVS